MHLYFIDKEHETMFYSLIDTDSDRIYYMPLMYLLTMDRECRKHIKQIYNFEERCIIPDCLAAAWVTGSSRRTLNLAFNLYTDNTAFTDNVAACSISNIFDYSAEYNFYYWNAIKMRYRIDEENTNICINIE